MFPSRPKKHALVQDKTFIGKASKGTLADTTLSRHEAKSDRLFEQSGSKKRINQYRAAALGWALAVAALPAHAVGPSRALSSGTGFTYEFSADLVDGQGVVTERLVYGSYIFVQNGYFDLGGTALYCGSPPLQQPVIPSDCGPLPSRIGASGLLPKYFRTVNNEYFSIIFDGVNGATNLSPYTPPANVGPVITQTAPQSVVINEDAPSSAFSLILQATDTDGDTLTWSVSTAATKGVAAASGTGVSKQITYTPHANANGEDSFVVQVSDGNGGEDTITVDVNITPVNDAPTGALSISGAANEDATLTADTSAIADADVLGPFSYVWLRNNVLISGAEQSMYQLTQADVGAMISARISYTDEGNTFETINSQATASVVNVNDLPTGSVTITGSAIEDQTLTASNTLADEDGLAGFNYQWYRGNVAINAATAINYTLVDEDVDDAISVKIVYIDLQGSLESVSSVPTAAVTNINDAPSGSVTISGNAIENQALTANSTLADADGLGSLSYQWYRGNVAISSATATSYTLVDADVGDAIKVTVSYTDQHGTAESVSSALTAAVTNVNDTPSGSVTISGLAVEAQTLTGDAATVMDEDGLGELSYQWLRNGNAIAGATSTQYDVATADIGTTLILRVSYTDVRGEQEHINSAGFGPIKADLDRDGIADDVDTDIDGDGISNAYEEANGLDPLDASDALLDSDGDGVNNLDEFTAGTNAQVDDYPPVIILDDEVTIDAVALLTHLPDNLASANDVLDGGVSVSHNLNSDLLAPGEHTITWTARDAAGNAVTAKQTLNVRPLANWQVDQNTGEDNTLTVSLHLNGEAPEYPVVANYSISGSATNPDDHNAQSGSLTLESGIEAQITVSIVGDTQTENDENIVFTLDSITNAAIGEKSTHKVIISEFNHAPMVTVSAVDANSSTSKTLFDTSSGTITLSANVDDVDTGDSHSFAWDADNALAGTTDEGEFSFDAAIAGAGTYQVSVTATDDASDAKSGSDVITITVVDALPNLDNQDSDGDGTPDNQEGFADSDGDNVPDFADSTEARNLLAIYPLGGEPVEGAWFVESQAGLNLELNIYGSGSGKYSPLVADEDLVDNDQVEQGDTGYAFENGIFDFVVSNMPVQGESVNVVIPQVNAVPENAVYRKETQGVWGDFVEDDNNQLSSAPGERGVCPPPGSDAYQPGLTTGDYCVQLTIEDGGPNDADGKVDGNIVDPGGLGVALPSSVNSSKGGGSLGFSLLALLTALAARLLMRRKPQVSKNRNKKKGA